MAKNKKNIAISSLFQNIIHTFAFAFAPMAKLVDAPPDFVIAYPKILHQRVWRFSDALPSTWFGCKPPCSEVV